MRPAVSEIRFYRVDRPYGWLSNFSPHPFDLDGQAWPTVEHYFQAQKFEAASRQDEIRRARSPMDAKRLGRRRGIREDWDGVRDTVMLKACLAKFTQHVDLAASLIETGDVTLIEDAPRDYYWGVGRRGTGRNQLGRILMDVRQVLVEGPPAIETDIGGISPQ